MMENSYIGQAYRRMYGNRWDRMTEEERKKAMSDPFMQGRIQGERATADQREAAERARGFKMGSQGTGFDR